MNGFDHWSRVGLGTGTLASLGRGTSQKMVCDLLTHCADYGVNVIDTADSYTSGRCEAMLGLALKGRRPEHVLVSKAGYRYGDLPTPFSLLNPIIKKAYQKSRRSQCFKPEYITHSVERSLKRLKTDYLDCFLLHNPTLASVKDTALLTTLENLQKRGLTRQIGVSTDEPEVAKAASANCLFRVLQTPANPTTLESFSSIWKDAASAGIHLMANHIFYSGRYRTPAPQSDMTTHEFLLRSISGHFQQGTLLVGTRNRKHLQANVDWAKKPIL